MNQYCEKYCRIRTENIFFRFMNLQRKTEVELTLFTVQMTKDGNLNINV